MSVHPKLYPVVWLALVSICGALLPASAQDRNIQINEVYPAALFKENGGRIINVKKLVEAGIYTQNAVGDGVTDDSDAIIAAMNWVMNRLKVYWGSGGNGNKIPWKEFWTIYLPDGTYRITKPLSYTGGRVIDPIFPNDTTREGTCRLMIIGQSRDGVVLRLDDNLPAFGASSVKPVLSYSYVDPSGNSPVNNNMPAAMVCRNLTVDVGANAGAVGIDFCGANAARMDNVCVTGAGKIGIFLRQASAHGYCSNIVINGMDYGIYMQDRGVNNDGALETHGTFEYVTLYNQNIAGIYQEAVSSSLRKIFSANQVTGLKLAPLVGSTTRVPQAVVLDSSFLGGHASNAAIQIDAGELYARDITVNSYGATVRKGAVNEVTGNVQEYVSGTPFSYDATRISSGPYKGLKLAVEDYPVVPWISDFSQWANVDDYPGTDVQKIQAAMNSGKKVVYFPKNTYTFGAGETVTLPATVEQLIGCKVRINGSGNLFDVNAASSTLLVFNNLYLDSGQIVQTAPRDILFESTESTANMYQSNLATTGTKIFVNNANGFARVPGSTANIQTWVRFDDNEKPSDFQYTADSGCVMWLFGFKSEKTWSVFRVDAGARLEVLGGVMSRNGTDASPDRAAIVNNGGDLSVVTATIGNYASRNWNPLIQDTQNGVTHSLAMSAFPSRGWNGNVIIPLYASYYPPNAPPATPSNLVAIAGNAEANLNWDIAAGAATYNVYRGNTSGGEGTIPVSSGLANNYWLDSGLTNGTTYYYQVRGVNGNGVSAPSNEAVATPTTNPVKLTPAGATCSDSEWLRPALLAIDGNTSTRWSASVLSCPPAHWLQVDLGSVQTFNTVKTLFFNGLTYTYDISVSSDNVTFTTVVPSRNTTTPYQFETDSFAPVAARYVRINISSKNGGGPNTKPGILETEVYQ